MATTWLADNAALVADLNDLLQLDRDAIETYTVAINSVRDPGLRDTLVAFRADHHRHAEALAALVRAQGAMAIELPHITGPLKMAVQAMGGVTRRDANVLLALRIVEGQIRDKYGRYAAKSWPEDVAAVVKQGADDEARHYAWVLERLREQGYGDQTLAGSVGAAAEAFHTLVAGPIEAVSRQMMQMVEQVRPDRGTPRQTGAIDTVGQGFRHALHALESEGRTDWMLSLFTEQSVLTSPRTTTAEKGLEGATRFWAAYREGFQNLTTIVDSMTSVPGISTLQWSTRGVTTTGTAVNWRGVTVLEHQDGKITRLQMLYDPAQMAA